MTNYPQTPFVSCPPCEGMPVEQLGGTIVPPSDFQSESTKSPMVTGLSSDFPHACPSAHAPAPTQAPNFRNQRLIDNLISKVRAMRNMQSRYFATRDGLVLRQSMTLEREVDKLLKQFPPEKQQFTQTSIF